jgi:hypothetical protein
MTKGDTVDDRSFDNLVRELAASVQSRRALSVAAVGLGLSLIPPLASDTEAARRRQGKRKKGGKSGKGKRGSSGKGAGGGKKPHDGHGADCGQLDTCPRDPETGKPGFVCPDGQCSCGGQCCDKGYACFVENSTPGREVCCYIDGDQSPLPEDAKLVSCPGDLFDPQLCCELEHCQPNGTCSNLMIGRYRRNPR